jgi:hypothetical protein
MRLCSQSNTNFERRIEPFLYRVIRLNDDNPHVYTALLRAIKAKPPNFFHDAVRHFAFVSGSDSAADAKKILALCTGIVNFGCYNTLLDPAVPALFVGRRLQRLSLDLQSLFPPGCVDLGHSMFGYVTHLDMFDESGVDELLPDIPLLPALTHLSLVSDTPWESALGVLEDCPRLELLFMQWFDMEPYKSSQTPQAYDIRFVWGLCEDSEGYWDDWERGARGSVDFWVRGDDFVRRKRKGEIEGRRLNVSTLPKVSHVRFSYPVLVGLRWSADSCPACTEFLAYTSAYTIQLGSTSRESCPVNSLTDYPNLTSTFQTRFCSAVSSFLPYI